jgi:D-3-phosphoglycerate dehydrogenase
MGWQCESDYESDRSAILNCIGDYEGIVIRSRLKIDAEMLMAAKNLKFIARAGSGMENVDETTAKGFGIHCFNAPEGNRDAVAEHVIGMLLSLFNKINTADMEVRRGEWNREANRGTELLGRTVGIIGYGNTGYSLAKRLAGFGVLAYGYDKYKKSFADNYAIEVDMQTILDEADVVSLHVPLTEETHHMINDEFFNRLANPIFLINTSRGSVVDTEALVRAIESGKVLGACLDVLENEKSSFENLNGDEMPTSLQYLLDSNKVILTPHVAGWTMESNIKLSQVLLEKIRKVFSQAVPQKNPSEH